MLFTRHPGIFFTSCGVGSAHRACAHKIRLDMAQHPMTAKVNMAPPLQHRNATLNWLVQAAAAAGSLTVDLPPRTHEASLTIASVCVPTSSRWEKLCTEVAGNYHGYASRHGYGLLLFGRNLAFPRALPWAKLPALKFALQGRDSRFAFWMDADSLFAQWQVRLAPQAAHCGVLARCGCGGALRTRSRSFLYALVVHTT